MKTVLRVSGMSCEHCVEHVRKALAEIAGVERVEVSLSGQTASVEHGGGVALEALKAAVVEAGYETA
jgi:copper ion binding protein